MTEHLTERTREGEEVCVCVVRKLVEVEGVAWCDRQKNEAGL